MEQQTNTLADQTTCHGAAHDAVMMDNGWLDTLDAPTRARAERSIALLKRAGVADAERYIRFEIEQDTPQVAATLFLKSVWVEAIDCWEEQLRWLQDPAACGAAVFIALRRLLARGATLDDLEAVVRSAVEFAMFQAMVILDDGYFNGDLGAATPCWALTEIDANGDPTGRAI